MHVAKNRLFPVVAALALGGYALLAGCDVGGSTSPTPTVIPTQTIAVPTTAPTDTAVPPAPTDTVAPTEAATATEAPAATSSVSPTPAGSAADYQWGQAGLAGKKVNALSLFASGSNPVLAAGPDGAWKSSYNYTNWETLNVNPGGQTQSAAIVSPDNMVVTGNIGCASGGPIQAFYSKDAGATWKPISGPNTPVRVIAANSQLVYGTICNGLVKSTDGGATWNTIPGPNAQNYDPGALTIGPDGQMLYVAYYSEGGTLRVFHSGQAAGTWTEVTPGNLGDLHGPVVFATAPVSEGHPEQGGLYMATGDGRLMMLPEGSSDWKTISPDPNSEKPQADYMITALWVDTTNSEEYNKPGPIIYAARAAQGTTRLGLGVYRSVDGGANWEQLGKGLGQAVINSLVLAPQDLMIAAKTTDVLIAATDDGIWTAPMPPPFH